MKTNVDYYFAKIIQEQKIQDWKAKDFWQAILSHGITENNINRQRLYGLSYAEETVQLNLVN